MSGRFYYLKDHFTLLDHAAAEKACLATGSRLPHPGKLACVQDLLRENGDAQVAWMWETMGPGNALASNDTVISDSARLRVICEQACEFARMMALLNVSSVGTSGWALPASQISQYLTKLTSVLNRLSPPTSECTMHICDVTSCLLIC